MEKPRSQPAGVRRHLKLVPAQTSPRRIWDAWKWVLAGAGLGLFVLAVGLIYTSPLSLPPETFRLERGLVEATHDEKALLIRRETVHHSPVSGDFHRLAGEGERVRVGTRVAEVVQVPAAADPPVGARKAPGTGGPPTQNEAVRNLRSQLTGLEQQLFALALQLREAQNREDVFGAERIQNQLDELARRQVEVAESLSAIEQGGAPYVPASAPAVSSGPAGEVTPIEASAAGIVIYSVDGLEEVATPGAVPALTPTLVRSFHPSRHSAPEGPVAPGQPLFKIVDNVSLLLAVVLPKENTTELSEDSVLPMRLQEYGGKVISFRIERLVAEGDSVLLVMVPETFPDELITARRPTVRLITWQYEGLVAPVAAVDWSRSQPGIYVQEGRSVTFVPIKVLGQNETHIAFEADIREGASVLAEVPGERR